MRLKRRDSINNIFVNKAGSTDWQVHSEVRISDGANTKLSWRFLVDGFQHDNEGMSMGCLRWPLGQSLPLQHHEEQETYFILSGIGEILMSGSECKSVTGGDSIYIPNYVPHGLKNTGDTDLMFLWVFLPIVGMMLDTIA